MELRRRKVGHVNVVCGDQQLDLCAAGDDAFGSSIKEAADDVEVRRLRFSRHHTPDEFVVDDVVDRGQIGLLRHDNGESVGFEAAPIEVLLHRVASSEQSDGGELGRRHGLGCAVGKVKERHVDRCLDLVSDDVHRVGTQHDALGPGPDQRRCISSQELTRLMPLTVGLECFDRCEVVGPDDEVGGVRASEFLSHHGVDDALVLDRRFPTHATEKADRARDGGHSTIMPRKREACRRHRRSGPTVSPCNIAGTTSPI